MLGKLRGKSITSQDTSETQENMSGKGKEVIRKLNKKKKLNNSNCNYKCSWLTEGQGYMGFAREASV